MKKFLVLALLIACTVTVQAQYYSVYGGPLQGKIYFEGSRTAEMSLYLPGHTTAQMYNMVFDEPKYGAVGLLWNTTTSELFMLPYGVTSNMTSKKRLMSTADSSGWITTALGLKAAKAAPVFTGVSTLPGIKMTPRAVAAGDSVIGTMYLRTSDSNLVMWSGTAWISVQDLTP